MSGCISVGILEDDAEFREMVAEELDTDPRTRVVWTAATSKQATASALNEPPTVILVDLGLPDLRGDRFILSIKDRLTETDFLVISVFEDYDRIFRALCAGASGYLSKSQLGSGLVNEVVDLANGGSPMSSVIARKVVTAFKARVAPATDLDLLSRREQEVVHQLALGKSYQEIADDVALSIETVRTHIRNIYRKLQVHTRAEVVEMLKG